jgi:hypothetical protein
VPRPSAVHPERDRGGRRPAHDHAQVPASGGHPAVRFDQVLERRRRFAERGVDAPASHEQRHAVKGMERPLVELDRLQQLERLVGAPELEQHLDERSHGQELRAELERERERLS